MSEPILLLNRDPYLYLFRKSWMSWSEVLSFVDKNHKDSLMDMADVGHMHGAYDELRVEDGLALMEIPCNERSIMDPPVNLRYRGRVNFFPLSWHRLEFEDREEVEKKLLEFRGKILANDLGIYC